MGQEERQVAETEADDVLIKVMATGLCGQYKLAVHHDARTLLILSFSGCFQDQICTTTNTVAMEISLWSIQCV